jgi:hypothetical protein
MTENPYEAPQFVEEPRPRSAWRRLTSLPLLVIGFASVLNAAVLVVAMTSATIQRLRIPGEVIIGFALSLVIGAVMLWSGLRLRK